MPALDDVALDLLLEAITDPITRRRVIGRLRPRMVGRPHPIVRLPRRRRPGLLPLAPLPVAGTLPVPGGYPWRCSS